MSSVKDGYRAEAYVSTPPLNSFCPLCRKIINDPRQCSNGHCFCCGCISKSLDKKAECPVCKIRLTVNKLSKNLVLQSAIDGMETFCISCEKTNSTEGTETDATEESCKWTGVLADRIFHYENECEFRPLICPNASCGQMISKKKFNQHVQSECSFRPDECKFCKGKFTQSTFDDHFAICSFTLVPCSNGCNSMVPNHLMETHLENECPLSPMICPLYEPGLCYQCSGTFKRNQIESHFREPDRANGILLTLAVKNVEQGKNIVTLLKQSRDLTEQNAEFQTKLKTLSKENTQERKKTVALEAKLAETQDQVIVLTARMEHMAQQMEKLIQPTQSTPIVAVKNGHKAPIHAEATPASAVVKLSDVAFNSATTTVVTAAVNKEQPSVRATKTRSGSDLAPPSSTVVSAAVPTNGHSAHVAPDAAAAHRPPTVQASAKLLMSAIIGQNKDIHPQSTFARTKHVAAPVVPVESVAVDVESVSIETTTHHQDSGSHDATEDHDTHKKKKYEKKEKGNKAARQHSKDIAATVDQSMTQDGVLLTPRDEEHQHATTASTPSATKKTSKTPISPAVSISTLSTASPAQQITPRSTTSDTPPPPPLVPFGAHQAAIKSASPVLSMEAPVNVPQKEAPLLVRVSKNGVPPPGFVPVSAPPAMVPVFSARQIAANNHKLTVQGIIAGTVRNNSAQQYQQQQVSSQITMHDHQGNVLATSGNVPPLSPVVVATKKPLSASPGSQAVPSPSPRPAKKSTRSRDASGFDNDIQVGTLVEYLSKKDKWVGSVVLEVNRESEMYLVETSCKQQMDVHISSLRKAPSSVNGEY